MVEMRPIKENEAERFLTILCDVFSLDRARASSVFYSEPFFDLNRKWAVFENGWMVSILTTTPMEFGMGKSIGIAGVATLPAYRGRGLSQQLLELVLGEAEAAGEAMAMLFAHETTLYSRVGFEVMDKVVRGPLVTRDKKGVDALEFHDVSARYEAWQKEDPRRLIRDSRRWKHWQWVYRSCEPVGASDYLCYEPLLCREAVLHEPMDAWPLTDGTEWLGLRSMTRELGVPLASEREELIFMGRGFGECPQMFMTDQF